MKIKSKIFVLSALTLLVMQAFVILFSWIISAVWPSLGINSLLSGGGLRWLLSSLSYNISDNLFISFLLFCLFVGTFIWSGLPKKIISFRRTDYRERFAVNFFFLIMFIAVAVCVLLAVLPHSALLGITGHLFPGPYLHAVAVILGIALFGGSVAFLILAGKLKDYESAEKACIFGLQGAAPLIVIYFLLKELIEMVVFVVAK